MLSATFLQSLGLPAPPAACPEPTQSEGDGKHRSNRVLLPNAPPIQGDTVVGRPVEDAGQQVETDPIRELVGDQAHRLLQEQGWVAVRSGTLDGEKVVWVRDSDVRVPASLVGYVQYTLDELKRVRTMTRETLRLVHEVKCAFDGTLLNADLTPTQTGELPTQE